MDTQQQKSWNVLLVGDSCLDIYHYGVCERMSPEAPVPVFRETKKEKKSLHCLLKLHAQEVLPLL